MVIVVSKGLRLAGKRKFVGVEGRGSAGQGKVRKRKREGLTNLERTPSHGLPYVILIEKSSHYGECVRTLLM